MQRVTSFILAFLIFGSAVVSAVFVIQSIRSEQSASSQTSTIPTQTEEQPVNEQALQGKPLANFTPSSERMSEVKSEDLVLGSGAEVTSAGQTVTVHYTGAQVSNGTVFQSSKDTSSPFTSPLNQLIAGWQTGMIGMKVGGTRRITIPAAQAYGDDASTGRPTGDLVFDIELLDVK